MRPDAAVKWNPAYVAELVFNLFLQENISSGRAQEGLTVYHEGGQMLPSSDAGQQAELLDRLGLGVKLLSGEAALKRGRNTLGECEESFSSH
jgi:hypothetical protein